MGFVGVGLSHVKFYSPCMAFPVCRGATQSALHMCSVNRMTSDNICFLDAEQVAMASARWGVCPSGTLVRARGVRSRIREPAVATLFAAGTVLLQGVAAFCTPPPDNLPRGTTTTTPSWRHADCGSRLFQTPWSEHSSYIVSDQSSKDSPSKRSPTPIMPSLLFQDLALSQLELLASSMPSSSSSVDGILVVGSKIKSMALYLPQENGATGQLEFLPAVLYPHPKRERVFIASDSDSGVAPEIPLMLSKLPGFAHATSLLPGYPMVSMSGSEAGVGVVEEVLCDLKLGGTALSVPLFAGMQTVGVLLVSPTASPDRKRSMWTDYDRQQVARAAKSLSLALSMDTERTASQLQKQQVLDELSDSLHQFKNPLQALRTYGKLLQRRMADGAEMTPQLLELAEHLVAQSDRLVERLKPVDAIVNAFSAAGGGGERRLLALKPVEAKALVPWRRTPNPHSSDAPFEDTSAAANGVAAVAPLQTLLAEETAQLPKSQAQSSLLLGAMELEMAFVTDVLDPVFAAFRAIATERGISFRLDVVDADDLPGVTIWPPALQEAVINLLDNAFKYVSLPSLNLATSTTKPLVRVRLLPNKDHRSSPRGAPPGVTILVEDNGPGIPERDREAAFERGFRSAEAQAIDGSGIGLDIARSLTEQMGGTLRIVDHSSYPNSLGGAVLELVVYRQSAKRN